jgi:hypothetical protein
MSWDDLKGLKYYLGFAVVVISFYIYSNLVGWRWLNTTKTTHEQGASRSHSRGYFYHK